MGMSRAEHSMGVVTKKTGLTSHVLRAWENRYGAVRPSRSSGNQRLYSDEDVARLMLLKTAVDNGRRIGDISHLPTAELRRLIREDSRGYEQVPGNSASVVAEDPPGVEDAGVFVAQAMRYIADLSQSDLRETLTSAQTELGLQRMLDGVVTPILDRLGEDWRQGALRVYHEHMATACIRGWLANRLARMAAPSGAPKVIAATPPRQTHEIGALLAALTAAMEGLNATYLGPNVPLEDLAKACKDHDAAALLLSIVHPAGDKNLPDELVELDSLCDGRTEIMIGGRAAEGYVSSLAGTRIEYVDGLESLRSFLSLLHGSIAQTR